MQKWKIDPLLHSCPVEKDGVQIKKKLDYEKVFVEEFLNKDPLKDWESFSRCKRLFEWAKAQDNIEVVSILDVGTKDGQFPTWLEEIGYKAIGIEISKPYVEYAQSKKRHVEYGDVCNLKYEDNTFDMVFSHHVLGLTSDIKKALSEMYRVSKRYIISLAEVPGNKKKHYSYIDSPQIFHDFVEHTKCTVLYNNYLPETGYKNEWVIFVEKGKT
jgi:SAM-dependent methyltransferase